MAVPLRAALVDLSAEAAKELGSSSSLVAQADAAHATVVLLVGVVEATGVQIAVTAPRFRETSLRQVVDEQIALLRRRLGDARAARLRLAVDVDPAVTMDADRGLLGQAVSNVLQNAVEAYPADSNDEIPIAIAARLHGAGTMVALVVRDTGRGIEPGTLGRLGEPFVSSKGSGRGLGVLNVKRMVEVVHGGLVEVDSEPGKGTTVSLLVPRKQPERALRSRGRRSRQKKAS